jgi:Fe-S-cluster-containing dehydrogenase component/DMSO reductase anchor subunit
MATTAALRQLPQREPPREQAPLEQPSPKQAPAQPRQRLPLIQHYLSEQSRLTAVDRFSQLHEADALPAQARYYKSLLPLEQPKAGQQFAFSVDLDRCTGCKACVTACHNLNGLDEEETWRSVGLLHGGSVAEPVQQTVTTACHHCVDPGCLNGCPVNAYEKDPITGIVRHLDDQCIGCQYCTLTCPYEVPQFNKRLGIVRKCDMCSDRLAANEAPACVQACPSEAISIRIVEVAEVRANAAANQSLPGAPSPSITLPSTEYKSKRTLPGNTLPADFYNLRPAHNHLPLVFMLVLTQLSVGAFAVDYTLAAFSALSDLGDARRYHTLLAMALGLLALAGATLHLGRPQYGFRALVGIGHSWMSREILCFGVFAKLAICYAGVLWANPLLSLVGLPALDADVQRWLARGLGAAVISSGLAGLACSALLYAVTRRTWWRLSFSGTKFLGTTLVLGIALSTWVLTTLAFAGASVSARVLGGLYLGLILATAAKLLDEASLFLHLRDPQPSDLKRSATLMRGALAPLTRLRFAAGVLGGLVLPAIACMRLGFAGSARATALDLILVMLGALALIAGEMLERSLFFMAVAPPKMPGAVGQ